MKAYNTIHVKNNKDIEYIKKHRFNLFYTIITGPPNNIDKIAEDEQLYTQLILQQNRFAVNNYRKEEK